MLFSCVIQSKQDLNSVLDYVLSFSNRNNSKKENEVFNFCLFLICCYNFSMLSLPFDFIKDESPDFKLRTHRKVIGIEHTMATEKKFKSAESKMKKNPKLWIEAGTNRLFNPDDPDRNMNLEGSGFPGDMPDGLWVRHMIKAINKKTKLLNTNNFEKMDENHLLIEDDVPTSFLKNETSSISYLQTAYKENNNFDELNFDKIHIVSEPTFVYDVFGECIKADISKKNLHIERIP